MAWIEVIIIFIQNTTQRSEQSAYGGPWRQQRRISFSAHFELREKERNLDRKEIIGFLNGGLDRIIAIEDRFDEEDEKKGLGRKYMLLYRKNDSYDVNIIISLQKDGSYKIVTAREQNVKKRGYYGGLNAVQPPD